MKSLLPPPKKNWKEGEIQIGLFIRDKTGATVEAVSDKSTPTMIKHAMALLKSISEEADEKG